MKKLKTKSILKIMKPMKMTLKKPSKGILMLLSKYDIGLETFQTMALAEGFTNIELADLEYMEDKFDTWKELFIDDYKYGSLRQ